MKSSPLQLLQYFIGELSLSANPAFERDKDCDSGMDEFSVGTTAKQKTAPEGFQGHSWSIEMQISQGVKQDKNFPYEFKLVIVGMFAFLDETLAEEKEAQFVRINGSSILYGAAREILRSTTALGPWDSLIIPGISFYEKQVVQEAETAPVQNTD